MAFVRFPKNFNSGFFRSFFIEIKRPKKKRAAAILMGDHISQLATDKNIEKKKKKGSGVSHIAFADYHKYLGMVK